MAPASWGKCDLSGVVYPRNPVFFASLLIEGFLIADSFEEFIYRSFRWVKVKELNPPTLKHRRSDPDPSPIKLGPKKQFRQRRILVEESNSWIRRSHSNYHDFVSWNG